ncbi:hypothetical protein [Nesterenkonia sp.]|uniref:hypothetical protein n=1 Tax=Nesterenkonia sp. TaxID=704201 RepID=UPI0026269199|nr:hypothetical protein [Nesterenkonia sp.]
MSAPTAAWGALGRIGPNQRQRLQQMTALAASEGVHPATKLDTDQAALYGTGIRRSSSQPHQMAAAWNAAGHVETSTLSRPWPQTAQEADACGLRIEGGHAPAVLHAGVSGTQVLYIHITEHAVFFATRLHWLAATGGDLTPDWQAWAEILAFGAPLQGRTTFTELQRLMPMQYIQAGSGEIRRGEQHWPWEDYLPKPGAQTSEATETAVEAMAALMRPHLRQGPANPMLSGGRDSRMLTALALRESAEPEQVTAWTTSSDTGSAMEELVGARTAQALGVRQRLITGSYGGFGQDFLDYADAVDYQASFHVWLTPAARELAQHPGAIFDGIGGGVFLGGGFADPDDAGSLSDRELIGARIAARSRYLTAAPKVLSPQVGHAISAAARTGAAGPAERYLHHPNGHTLTAYLIRTVPGISLAPARVLGRAQPTAMPMVSDTVVRAALELPLEAKADGAWYPELLAAADPRLDGMPTADDLIGTHHRRRRIASREGAAWLAARVRSSEVRHLLSSVLAEADPAVPGGLAVWQRALSTTRPQHLLRGLALLAQWLEVYGSQLTEDDPRRIADAG